MPQSKFTKFCSSGAILPQHKMLLNKSGQKSEESLESIILHCLNKQSDSLIPITENKHMFNNIHCFHNSNDYKIKQYTVCFEAWPLVSSSHSQKDSANQCVRCNCDKKHPKKFSKQNHMVPSAVPSQLQGLIQIEEMLIAHALPIMQVYIKPGGQRGYSGHCINFPQHVQELATSLPRYPKQLSLIVTKMKGKDNTFKDVTVRRQNALTWLINNNPDCQDVEQGWHSGESTRLSPMWPGFDSGTWCHIWVKFVVGSLLCSRRFSPGTPVFPSP